MERWSATAVRLALFLAVIVLSFPAPIHPVGTGLESWTAAINVASARGLIFGRDVIFNYGPLGFALIPVDIGSDAWAWHTMIAQLLIYITFWISTGLVLFHLDDFQSQALFAFVSVVSTGTPESGSVYTLAVLGFLIVGQYHHGFALGTLAAGVSAAALLSKFNIGVSSVAALFAWVALAALREGVKTSLAKGAVVFAALFATIVLAYRALGGNFRDLADFFRYSAIIANDYSSQMTLEGPMWELALILAGLASIVVYMVAGLTLGWKSWQSAAILLLPLFFEYKRAITRHDEPHFAPGVLTFAAVMSLLMVGNEGRIERAVARSLAAASIVIGLVATGWRKPLLALLGVVALFALGKFVAAVWRSEKLGSRMARGMIVTMTLAVIAGASLFLGAAASARYPGSFKMPRGPKHILALFHLKQWRETSRDQAFDPLEKLPPGIIATIGNDAVDDYPIDLFTALMNHLNWSPRFILESYQAYNPPLDERCADHFRNADAPRFILYKHIGLESKQPAVIDPKTWWEIYRWYEFEDEAIGRLLLRRRQQPRWQGARPLGTSTIELGERWEVPKGQSSPIMLKARLDLNTMGRLVRTLFRVEPPKIRIEYEDGTIVDERIAWRNAESGFMVSDLPRDLRAARSLFQGGIGNRVRAVSFLGDPRYFKRTIPLEWSALQAFSSPP